MADRRVARPEIVNKEGQTAAMVAHENGKAVLDKGAYGMYSMMLAPFKWLYGSSVKAVHIGA